MVRIMLEAWQRVLASLDSLPVGYRTDLGRFILDALAALTQAEQGTTAWRMRTFLAGPDWDQLGFARLLHPDLSPTGLLPCALFRGAPTRPARSWPAGTGCTDAHTRIVEFSREIAVVLLRGTCPAA
ncbi:hypothetical protein [Streptomyces buecherae]|uniref:hypothetical protein n=1 Tax=Streptomyces buecherae TaxID=2763006 RepID=UPI001E53DA4F|nr:hypothetical protein [Streptomyces buecherae]